MNMCYFKRSVALFCLSFIMLESCNNAPETNTKNIATDSVVKNETSIMDSLHTSAVLYKSPLSDAKETAKTIFEYVEQADTKKITKKQLDKKAMPLQKHLDSLRKVLSEDEIKDLDEYRTQLVSEMVDRKVNRNN